ncbi:hypothetical protein [Haladaptatus sp. NG-WS-4]
MNHPNTTDGRATVRSGTARSTERRPVPETYPEYAVVRQEGT